LNFSFIKENTFGLHKKQHNCFQHW